ESIYFGGGTPSLLSVDAIKQVLDPIFQDFEIDPAAEITLEANPDDLSLDYLHQLKQSVVNRLSIGIQSFNDEELRYVNRVHNSKEAINSVYHAQEVGFDNLSVDLIYGIPNSTIKSWERNLEIVEKMQVSHLSAYSLTQEPNTAYDILVKKGKLQAPVDEQAVAQYEILQDFLPRLNMAQYEISNYAAAKKYAKHNTNYWYGVPYLGLGPSAHSFNGESRRWNIAHLADYMSSAEKGEPKSEIEILSLNDKWNERIMTGIRTKWGLDLAVLQKEFPKGQLVFFEKQAEKYLIEGLLQNKENVYTLTAKGKLFADGIAAEFFRS
ncbi:MAG: radical SAM family heme chaperone HemW, partial [Bacteroidales bacterium]|nr:radical SAM family heme chaperone HemW [Bacteroidales bacterium]